MVLTVDIGNTHTVLGLFQEEALINHWRISSNLVRTEDEIGVLLELFFKQNDYRLDDVKGVSVSSVVPDLTSVYKRMARRYLRKEPVVVGSDLELGMKIKYRTPRTVGADRLCNAVAGKKKYGTPLIILDFGTATTFDCIDHEGAYLGGVICPGIETSIKYLHQSAAKLPRVEIHFPANVIGQTTDESIQSGILLGTVKMIEGLTIDIKHQLGDATKVVATGGLSRIIADRTNCIDMVDRYLSLEGMLYIYNMNQS